MPIDPNDIRLITLDELIEEWGEGPAYALDPWLPWGQVGLHGVGGSGKTTIAAALAHYFRHKRPVCGREWADENINGGVLILAGEGQDKWGACFRALNAFHDVERTGGIFIIPQRFDMWAKGVGATIEELVWRLTERARADGQEAIDEIGLVIVDSLSAYYGHRDMNDTPTMRAFLERLDEELCFGRGPGSMTQIILHHGDEAPRGSKAFAEACTETYRLAVSQKSKHEKTVTLRPGKCRFVTQPMSWRIQGQDVTTDSGEVRSFGVAVPVEAQEAARAEREPTARAKRGAGKRGLLTLLEQLYAVNGIVPVATWRAEAISKGIVSEHRQAFHRAVESLTKDGEIVVSGDAVAPMRSVNQTSTISAFRKRRGVN